MDITNLCLLQGYTFQFSPFKSKAILFNSKSFELPASPILQKPIEIKI